MEKCFYIKTIDLSRVLSIVFTGTEGNFHFGQKDTFDTDLGGKVKGFIVRYQWNALVDKKLRGKVNILLKNQDDGTKLPLPSGFIDYFEDIREQHNIMNYTTLCTDYIAECYWVKAKAQDINTAQNESTKLIFEEQFQIAMVMSGLLKHIFQDPYVATTLTRRYKNKKTEYDAAYGDQASCMAKAHYCDNATALPRTQISVSSMRRVLDPNLVGIAAFMAFAIYDTSTLNNFRVLLGREGVEAEDLHPSFRYAEKEIVLKVYKKKERDEPHSGHLFATQFDSGKLFVNHMIDPANRFMSGLINFLDFTDKKKAKPFGKDRMKGLLFRKVCSELVQAYATHGSYPTIDKKLTIRHPWLSAILNILDGDGETRYSFIQLMVEFVLLALENKVMVVTMSHAYVNKYRFVDQQNGKLLARQPKMHKFNFLFKIDPALHGNPTWIETKWTFNELVNIITIGFPDPFNKEFDAETYQNTFESRKSNANGSPTNHPNFILMESSNKPDKLYKCKTDKAIEKERLKESKKRKKPSNLDEEEKEVLAVQKKGKRSRKKRKTLMTDITASNLGEANEDSDDTNEDLDEAHEKLAEDREDPDDEDEPVTFSDSDVDLDEDDDNQRKPAAKETANDEDERKPAAKKNPKPARTSQVPETFSDSDEEEDQGHDEQLDKGDKDITGRPLDVVNKFVQMIPPVSGDGANDTTFHNLFEKSCDMAVEWVNSCDSDTRDEASALNYMKKLRMVQKMSLAVSFHACVQMNAIANGKSVVLGGTKSKKTVRGLRKTLHTFDCSGVTSGDSKVKWKGKSKNQAINPITFVHSKILNPLSQAVAQEVIENNNNDTSSFESHSSRICHYEKCKSIMGKKLVATPKGKPREETPTQVDKPIPRKGKGDTPAAVPAGMKVVATPKGKPREETPTQVDKPIPRKGKGDTPAAVPPAVPPTLRRSERSTPSKKLNW
jgi:hypothetical protein